MLLLLAWTLAITVRCCRFFLVISVVVFLDRRRFDLTSTDSPTSDLLTRDGLLDGNVRRAVRVVAANLLTVSVVSGQTFVLFVAVRSVRNTDASSASVALLDVPCAHSLLGLGKCLAPCPRVETQLLLLSRAGPPPRCDPDILSSQYRFDHSITDQANLHQLRIFVVLFQDGIIRQREFPSVFVVRADDRCVPLCSTLGPVHFHTVTYKHGRCGDEDPLTVLGLAPLSDGFLHFRVTQGELVCTDSTNTKVLGILVVFKPAVVHVIQVTVHQELHGFQRMIG